MWRRWNVVTMATYRPGGWGSAVGMGQCLRHPMHWDDLEEYQVGRRCG